MLKERSVWEDVICFVAIFVSFMYFCCFLTDFDVILNIILCMNVTKIFHIPCS